MTFSHSRVIWARNILILACLFFSQITSASDPFSDPLNLRESTESKPTRQSVGEASFFRLEEQIVHSASGYDQNILESPSAITVITKEDIEKAGYLDIWQLFRAVSGTLVIEGESVTPDVFVRDIPQRDSPRILLLMDGVPLYAPVSSNIPWQRLPFSLASIERIEIIRGASSTLYGQNAFSGVINVITKKAGTEQSVQVNAAGGNLETIDGEVIWNRPLGDNVGFRLEGLGRHDAGYGIGDGQTVGQGMFDLRADLATDTRLKVFGYGKGGNMTIGHATNGVPQFFDFGTIRAGLILDHDFNDQQNLHFQAAYEQLRLHTDLSKSGEQFIDSTDKEIQHDVTTSLEYTNHFSKRDTLVSGASFRPYIFHRTSNFGIPPLDATVYLASFFINNDFRIKNNLILTTGGRYEYDSFTHNQLTGRANLTWLPFSDQALRVSVARAIRTPSIFEELLDFTVGETTEPLALPPGGVFTLSGNRNLRPESVIDYELGYQGEFLHHRLHTGLQFYWNDINDLIFAQSAVQKNDLASLPPSQTVGTENQANVNIYGIEYELAYHFFDWWVSSLYYTFSRQFDAQFAPDSFVAQLGRFPTHIVNFNNRFVFKNGFSAELRFNWTSTYLFFDQFLGTSAPVPQIFHLDVRLAQKLLKGKIELGVVGTNLVHSPHAEIDNSGVPGTGTVDRRIYGTLGLKF